MKTETLHKWHELAEWAENATAHPSYVFRGQGSNDWPLQTSLARHFIDSPNAVNPHEWRKRELKMYRMFRERILKLCPHLYDDLEPQDILSLMQHHGVPTRMLDFTLSPWVAAFFALRHTRGDSAIWVIDRDALARMRELAHLPDYVGPTHRGGYSTAKAEEKHDGATVITPKALHPRVAAQSGCFLLPGRISKRVDSRFIHSKVTLSEFLVNDSLVGLRGRGISHESLFPELDAVVQDVLRFSTSGSAEYLEG